MSDRGAWVADPDDPTVPYSQQRRTVIDLVRAGLQALGLVGSATVLVDTALAEACDHGKAYPHEITPWWGGKPGEGSDAGPNAGDVL